MIHPTHRHRSQPSAPAGKPGKRRKLYGHRHAHVPTRTPQRRQILRAPRSEDTMRDALTGLADRRAFDGRLARLMARPPAAQDRALAVLFIDVDDFKRLNDRFGHSAGDAVLIEVAKRIAESVRPGDLVSRRGGDEFTVLLDGCKDCGDVVGVAERIQDRIRPPIAAEGRRLAVTVSVGIALRKPGADRPEDLVRRADEAMYCAKSWGKARSVVYGG